MRTEIVIPFAFDTAPLEGMLQEQGEQEVTRILTDMVQKNVIDAIPKETDFYGCEKKGGKPNWNKFLTNVFFEWLGQHHDEIIDEAALLLAQRASSKKRWRDVLRELKEEEEGND